MRTEKTSVVLTCDNCRVTSTTRDLLPTQQTWFRLREGGTSTLALRYDAVFCTEACGHEYLKAQAHFKEISRNELWVLLSPTKETYRMGNTD